MSVVTQGTQLYVVNNGVVSEVECITGFSPGSSPADQIEDTCLSEKNTPGQATATLNADPANDSHVMLSELAESNDQDDLVFAIGWADGESEPTYDASGTNPDAVDGLILPDDRTWYVFKGYVTDFPFDFQQNSVVQTSATIQRNGQGRWVPKAQPTS